MEAKGTMIEGLTFKELKEMMDLKFNYEGKINDLKKKEEELKEKYKLGTIEFPPSPGYRYQVGSFFETKDEAINLLKENIEALKNNNKELLDQLDKLKYDIQQIKKYHSSITHLYDKI